MLQRRHRAVDRVGFGAQHIGAAGDQGLGVEPDEMSLKLVGHMWAIRRSDQHIAPRQLDLVGEHNRHCLPLNGLGKIATLRHDAGDARGLAGLGGHHRTADRDAPPGDLTRKAAEILIRPHDRLDRETEGLVMSAASDLHRLEMIEQ